MGTAQDKGRFILQYTVAASTEKVYINKNVRGEKVDEHISRKSAHVFDTQTFLFAVDLINESRALCELSPRRRGFVSFLTFGKMRKIKLCNEKTSFRINLKIFRKIHYNAHILFKISHIFLIKFIRKTIIL